MLRRGRGRPLLIRNFAALIKLSKGDSDNVNRFNETDVSVYAQADLKKVARQLNERPRKINVLMALAPDASASPASSRLAASWPR